MASDTWHIAFVLVNIFFSVHMKRTDQKQGAIAQQEKKKIFAALDSGAIMILYILYIINDIWYYIWYKEILIIV